MAVVEIHRHRFSVEDFAHMGEAGIFAPDDRVELIDGEIREMAPIGAPHAAIVDRLAELLLGYLAGKAHVRIQNPIRLDGFTEPQPDLVVARRRTDYYAGRHPDASDVLLIIEVADSSLLYDQVEKAPRYAAAGIPEAWLVDVAGEMVTVCAEPGPGGYTREKLLRRGDEIVSVSVAEFRVAVDEIFGYRS